MRCDETILLTFHVFHNMLYREPRCYLVPDGIPVVVPDSYTSFRTTYTSQAILSYAQVIVASGDLRHIYDSFHNARR